MVVFRMSLLIWLIIFSFLLFLKLWLVSFWFMWLSIFIVLVFWFFIFCVLLIVWLFVVVELFVCVWDFEVGGVLGLVFRSLDGVMLEFRIDWCFVWVLFGLVREDLCLEWKLGFVGDVVFVRCYVRSGLWMNCVVN